MSVREAIARDLKDGPAWARSYQASKAVLDAMVADGEVERVAPPSTHFRNMVGLTKRGAEKYCSGDSGVVTVRSRAEEADDIAEAVANGQSKASVARQLGISLFVLNQRWKGIVEGLGWQAR